MDSPRPDEIRKHSIDFAKYYSQYFDLAVPKLEEDEDFVPKSDEQIYQDFVYKKPVSL